MEATAELVIAPENLRDCIGEILPLIRAHHEEIPLSSQPPDPDIERYLDADAQGVFCTVTARSEEELVGYAVFAIAPSLHYRGTLEAHQDILYLRPDHRRGFAGISLVRGAEAVLKSWGVHTVVHDGVPGTPFMRTLEYLGYIPKTLNMAKVL